MVKPRRFATALAVFGGAAVVATIAVGCCARGPRAFMPATPDLEQLLTLDVRYQRDIQPILTRRCVSCHSCYDAPGQLNLSCEHGVVRGATKQLVYDASRLSTAPHTRLHIDATDERGWRERGFFSILPSPDARTPAERLHTSLLYQMLALGRWSPMPPSGSIEHLVFDTHDPPTSPSIEEFPDFRAEFPHSGMPLFTAGITTQEWQLLVAWIAQGAVIEPSVTELSAGEQAAVQQWEALLNRPTRRDQLIARYLYEHWFLANLYFDDVPGSGYFAVKRSKTPPGQPFQAIVTDLPNDRPAVERVYYRLLETHVPAKRKTHLPYPLSAARLAWIQREFCDAPWALRHDVGFDQALRAAPFEVFRDIPARTRYAFMLEDADYFVNTFIRGPVCRGPAALNVLRDRFWIAFEPPEHDLICNDAEFAEAALPMLRLPGTIRSLLGAPFSYEQIAAQRATYVQLRETHLDRRHAREGGPTLADVWRGPSAYHTPMLTVFRHFDSASVHRGFLGPPPLTAWLYDYSLLERTYYTLSVNFDVYGPVAHQLTTRLYFDLIRHECENNLLRLLPSSARRAIQDEWYRGVYLQRVLVYQSVPTARATALRYDTPAPFEELLGAIATRCDRPAPADATLAHLREVMAGISVPSSAFVQQFPEIALLRIVGADGSATAYTLTREKAMINVAYIFAEGLRREPDRDRLTAVSGVCGDYPELILEVQERDLAAFSKALQTVDAESLPRFWDRYAIRRNDPRFWALVEWFVETECRRGRRYEGLLDLHKLRIR